MTENIKKSLFDIYQAIQDIESFVGTTKDFNQYKADRKTKFAVERALEIIGEATNRILKENENIGISHAKRIVSLRNRVIHAYDSIEDHNIWAIVINQIPLLKQEVAELLALDTE